MGKGNTCVFGDYEGLFYVDWDNFSTEWEDDCGNIVTDDYDFQREEWETSLDEFVSDFKHMYPSFCTVDEWISRNERAVLENELFYIAVEDNEWSMAIKLLQKESEYYNKEGLQSRQHKYYLEGIKKCLFNQFNEIGTYRGAWTSGTLKRA